MLRATALLLGLLALPAQAQVTSPEAVALLTRWAEATREAFDRVERVDYVETTDQLVDGPFNRHRLGSVADATLYPDRDRPERRIRDFYLDGRPVRPVRARIAQERLRRAIPGIETVLRAAGLPLQALRGLRPAGAPVFEALDGRPVVRVEAVPRTDRDPVERATFWFARPRSAREVPLLLRSQVILRPDVPRARPIIVTTDYDRIEGVPVPRRRRVEATLQQRRRIRTFTVLITVDLAFDDVRVVWR